MKEISPYLKNEYAPIKLQDESKEWEPLELTYGKIPEEINGYFLRNSPNPQFQPRHKYHWFDGDGFIQGVKITGGKAFFKGKFVRTDKFYTEKQKGKSLYGGLNSPINPNRFFSTLKSAVQYALFGKNPFPNTSNTDLVFHHGTLLSLWLMGGKAYAIDPTTLDTKGAYRFGAADNSNGDILHGISAHPKESPKDHRLFVMDFVGSWRRAGRPYLSISSISEDGSTISTRKIPSSGRHLLHDIAVTENYVLIIDMPAEMSPFGLKYNRKKPARFGVLHGDFDKRDKSDVWKGEDVLWFDDPSGCYIVHVINAYEEDDSIVLYALRKPYLEIKRKRSDVHTDIFDGYLHRWTLNMKTGKIMHDIGEDLSHFFSIGSEFPTINTGYEGLKHRFSYLPHVSRTATFNFSGFSKFDHETNTFEQYTYLENRYNGELRFVAHPGFPKEEDHGWLITFMHDYSTDQGRCYIEIFDAQNITQGPICKLLLPKQVPIGFHTVWIEAKDLV